jgi:hypothetical protein
MNEALEVECFADLLEYGIPHAAMPLMTAFFQTDLFE